MERRGVYIEKLEYASYNHPALIALVKQCLHNDPRERPSTEALLTGLQGLRAEVEGEYGGGAVRLDLASVRLAKEVKEKDRRLEEKDRRLAELTQQQVWCSLFVETPDSHSCSYIFVQAGHRVELEDMSRTLEDTRRLLEVSHCLDKVCRLLVAKTPRTHQSVSIRGIVTSNLESMIWAVW